MNAFLYIIKNKNREEFTVKHVNYFSVYKPQNKSIL